MLFFTKKEKLCPYCQKPMKEYPEYWTCNPCEALKDTWEKWVGTFGIGSGIPNDHYTLWKPRTLFQRIKDAVYIFRHGYDE